jgi:hypothetical protein
MRESGEVRTDHDDNDVLVQAASLQGSRGWGGVRTRAPRGSDMPKPKKAGGRVVRMSPLTIARIEAEVITLAVELKARDPDMTPAALQALKKRLRRAMGLIR